MPKCIADYFLYVRRNNEIGISLRLKSEKFETTFRPSPNYPDYIKY